MPEKVIHEIRLNQYSAVPADRTRRFSLGTKDSYGIEQLRIVPGEGWDGLTITATFHPPEGEAVQVIVPADGLIDVPPEATRSGSELPLKYGKIVFAGVADGMQRISCNLPYTVLDHAPVEGAESSGPSPSWYEQAAAHFVPSGGKAGQVLAKASDTDLDVEWADGGNGTADHAKLSNRDASDQHPISAITGLENALDAKQPAGSYLTQESDPTVPDWAKQPEKPSYTADEVGALSAATLPEAITTALAQATASGAFDGADGSPGKDGADGKSAYQYAQEGGYTGTEEEFAAKLAEEMPEALPNPNALTFTGAVTGSYDGSEALTVEIPAGGGGSGAVGNLKLELIASGTMDADARGITVNLDNDGNPFELSIAALRVTNILRGADMTGNVGGEISFGRYWMPSCITATTTSKNRDAVAVCTSFGIAYVAQGGGGNQSVAGPKCYGAFLPTETIKTVSLKASGAAETLGAGLTYYLYGVRV